MLASCSFWATSPSARHGPQNLLNNFFKFAERDRAAGRVVWVRRERFLLMKGSDLGQVVHCRREDIIAGQQARCLR